MLYGITAALLLGQYVIQRAPSLLFLVGAYVYGGTMVVFHALSFPGMFAPGGLLGAGPQTTAWIYFSWHGGASLAMAAYGLAARRGGGAVWREMSDRAGVLSALAAVLLALAAAAAVVLACTLGHDLLPRIMSGDADRSGQRAVAIVTMAMMALALPALPPACSTAVYRIVQEALGNVARHAGATHARVRVAVEEAQVRVLVSDDGRGFDPAGRHRAGATGMAGMRERVLALGGGLVIDSAPGRGARVEASIPLGAAVPEAP